MVQMGYFTRFWIAWSFNVFAFGPSCWRVLRWDPSATEVSQGGGSEAQQSDKWKVLQVQPTRRQTVLLQCPQPAPAAPAWGEEHGTVGKVQLQFTPRPQVRGKGHLQRTAEGFLMGSPICWATYSLGGVHLLPAPKNFREARGEAEVSVAFHRTLHKSRSWP